MRTTLRKKWWLIGGGVVATAAIGAMVWFFVPSLHAARAPMPAADYFPTNGWRTGTPEEQGFDSAKLAEGLQAMQEKHIPIDSLLIVRNGYIVLDAYFAPYDGSFPHDVASVTKSVMTTLIGIAVDQGKLQLDQPMISFFPNRKIANLDDRKQRITVRDLVSNRNGMESGCFAGDEPTLDKMRSQPDWVRAALDRKMVQDPGTSFCYDSPGMHLLSAILQQATGMTALDFAKTYLFEPLGIQEGAWEADPQGYTHGWGDLHLKPQDAAKLGYLWLQGGNWDGRQIISSAWTTAAAQAHSRLVGNEYGYGYGWWVSPIDYYATGRGGQFVRVIPTLNAIVVTTAGNLDFNEIQPFLVGLLIKSSKPLPANPAGVARLDAVLTQLVQSAAPQPVASLPGSARAISDKAYTFAPNATGVTRLSLEFNDPAEAKISLTQYGMVLNWPIGLDGRYRPSPDGRELRGYWQDSQTFILQIFDVGQVDYELRFDGDRVEFASPQQGWTLKGQIEQ